MKVTHDDGIVPYKPEPGIEYTGFRVDFTGTYAGKGDSSIDIGFTIKYVGTDGRVYADFDSHEGDEPLESGPNVVAGGTQTLELPTCGAHISSRRGPRRPRSRGRVPTKVRAGALECDRRTQSRRRSRLAAHGFAHLTHRPGDLVDRHARTA